MRDWKVETKKVEKSVRKLPKRVQLVFLALVTDLEKLGPIQKEWPNFSSLSKDRRIPANSFHCHLEKGRPTYVACWRTEKDVRLIEVFYAGTHENAPY